MNLKTSQKSISDFITDIQLDNNNINNNNNNKLYIIIIIIIIYHMLSLVFFLSNLQFKLHNNNNKSIIILIIIFIRNSDEFKWCYRPFQQLVPDQNKPYLWDSLLLVGSLKRVGLDPFWTANLRKIGNLGQQKLLMLGIAEKLICIHKHERNVN